MVKSVFIVASLVALSSFTVFSANAADGMDARTHAKVMRAKRMQAMDQNSARENNSGLPPVGAPQAQIVDPCKAGIDIGNVYIDKNSRNAPRENTVVVTGDVIFAPSRNCR